MKERLSTDVYKSPIKKAMATLAATAAVFTSSSVANAENYPRLESPPSTPSQEFPTAPSKSLVNCFVEKCIALTFDDGPEEGTNHIIDYLNDHDAKGTFFVLGMLAVQHPGVIKRMHDEGHQIGNHSWSHKLLTALSPETARQDAQETNEAIRRITGSPPAIMRPPYGEITPEIVDEIKLPQFLWTVDPQDWKYQSSSYVSQHILSRAHRGAIVLMHDIYGTTVDAVPQIVDGLQTQGYKLVTIEELYGKNLPPGIYSQQSDSPLTAKK